MTEFTKTQSLLFFILGILVIAKEILQVLFCLSLWS